MFLKPTPFVIRNLDKRGERVLGVHVIIRWLCFSWFYYWQFMEDET